MPRYQKAYLLRDLRRFPAWHEGKPRPTRDADSPEDVTEPLSDESIVFLHEDLHVSRDCFDQNDVLFDEVTPAWRDFCRDALEFRVPDWEEESRRVRETLARLEDGPDAR